MSKPRPGLRVTALRSLALLLILPTLLLLGACRDAGPVPALRQVSDVRAGLPILVFVYTDG